MKFRSPSLIACMLTVFFSAIMMYVLFGILLLADKSGGTQRIVFSILNCVLLVGLAVNSRFIVALTSFATAAQIWCITALYTILQFGAVFIKLDSWNGSSYILYQLIVLFVYLCIVLPAFNISYKKNNNPSKEI